MLSSFVQGMLWILLMVFSTGVVIDAFERFAEGIKVRRIVLATMLVGFATSLPELFVGISAGFQNSSSLALGNLMGANIINLSLVVGGAALVAGSIPVVGNFLKKDMWMAIGLALMPVALSFDGSLSRIDALLLLGGYLLYVVDVIRDRNNGVRQSKLLRSATSKNVLSKKGRNPILFVKLFLSLVVLAVSTYELVRIAVGLAQVWEVSYYWSGLVVLSLATTVPELVLSVMALKKVEPSLVLENLLGSVVVNSTLVLGIVALISPIRDLEVVQKGVASIFLVIIMGLFWLFTSSKHKIQRWEGAVLVWIFIVFVATQILLA